MLWELKKKKKRARPYPKLQTTKWKLLQYRFAAVQLQCITLLWLMVEIKYAYQFKVDNYDFT